MSTVYVDAVTEGGFEGIVGRIGEHGPYSPQPFVECDSSRQSLTIDVGDLPKEVAKIIIWRSKD